MEPQSGASPDLQHAKTSDLVAKLSEQVTALVRGELELAKTELAEKGKRVGLGAGLAGGAGVLAAYAFGVLLIAAIAALSLVWPVWLAALVVGVLLLIVAGVLVLLGRSQLRKVTSAVPEHAAQSIKDDVTAVREAAHR